MLIKKQMEATHVVRCSIMLSNSGYMKPSTMVSIWAMNVKRIPVNQYVLKDREWALVKFSKYAINTMLKKKLIISSA